MPPTRAWGRPALCPVLPAGGVWSPWRHALPRPVSQRSRLSSGRTAERGPPAGRWRPRRAPHTGGPSAQGCVSAHALGPARGALRRPHCTGRGSVRSDRTPGTSGQWPWPLRPHRAGRRAALPSCSQAPGASGGGAPRAPAPQTPRLPSPGGLRLDCCAVCFRPTPVGLRDDPVCNSTCSLGRGLPRAECGSPLRPTSPAAPPVTPRQCRSARHLCGPSARSSFSVLSVTSAVHVGSLGSPCPLRLWPPRALAHSGLTLALSSLPRALGARETGRQGDPAGWRP